MSAKVQKSPRTAHATPVTPTSAAPRRKPSMSRFRDLQTAPVLRKTSTAQPPSTLADFRKPSTAIGLGSGSVDELRRPSGWSGARVSLSGILGANRFLKRVRSSLKERESTAGESQAPQQLYEPTYRLEPKTPFNSAQVLEMLKDTLNDHLEGRTYRPGQSTILCRRMSDDIRQKVKMMGFDRHRVVVTALLGEKKGQGVMASSRCSWDEHRDSFASHTFQNKSLFCTVSVFGVYKE